MANEMQRGNLTGTAIMRMPISGTVSIGGKQMKELRFMPYSEFPETGREETLYIDTDGNAMYYWDGTEYIALSGGGSGGTSNYNELSNKPSINDITLTGNKTSADLGLQPTISDLATIRSGAASGATAVQPSDMETALADKQDVIDDLNDIRTGAGLGETAVQPSDMESALADKQDVISDLSTIRSGASAGATAVQPSDMETALSGKQDVISDLSDIRSGASAGATAVQPSALNDYQTKFSGTNKLDPSYIDYDASHRAVSDAEKSTWSGKQDTISDLSTIRSGAAAGATALQQSDVSSTYSATGTAPVNGTAVNAAIETLDVSSVGGSGKYISAISETNGKISATPTTFDTALSSSSTNNNAPTTKAVYDDQERQEAEIGAVANAGAKNLFADRASTVITTGITYTHNSDGTITASGTASDSGWHILSQNNTLKKGKYILSGGHSSNATCIISPTLSLSDAIAISSGDGIEFELSADTQGLYYALRTQRGTTLNNAIFKPMLRPASITDSTFQPYALPNPTLTPAAIKAVDEGAKNLFPIGVSSYTYASAVTCTVAADGKITVNGTNPNTSAGILYQDLVTAKTTWKNTRYTLPAGKYGCKGSGVTGLSIQVYCHDRSNVTELFNSKDDGVFEYTAEQKAAKPYIAWRLGISASVAISNATVQPMICTLADWNVSQKFVPHAPTNSELWQKINAIKRTYKVPISSTPVNGIYFGVQMFPFEFDSVPEGTVAVQNVGQGGAVIDPTKFTVQKNTWGFRIYTTDSTYAGLIPDVKIS